MRLKPAMLAFVLLSGYSSALAVSDGAKGPKGEGDPVGSAVCKILEISHYSRLKIEDIEREILEQFSDSIDPSRILISQDSISKTAGEFQKKLKDDISSGRYDAARFLTEVGRRKGVELQRKPEGETKDGGTDKPIIWSSLKRPDTEAELVDRWLTFNSFCKGRGEEAANRLDETMRDINFRLRDADALRDLFLDCVARGFDRHSEYQKPQRREEFERQLSLTETTTGVVPERTDEGKVVVKESFSGGPSVGEEIVSVKKDGREIEVKDLPVAVVEEYLRGGDGKDVEIQSVDDRGEVSKATVHPSDSPDNDASRARAVIVRRKGQRIGLLTLPMLYTSSEQGQSDSGRDTVLLLERLSDSGVNTTVIDMRGNSGGGVAEAGLLTGAFLGEETMAYGMDRDRTVQPFKGRGRIRFKGNAVCLVDAETGSAAELLAQALRHHGRAVVVGGGRTMGKGTAQAVLDLEDHGFFQRDSDARVGALKVSTILICGLDGRGIQGRGIVPDIIVPDGMETARIVAEMSGRAEVDLNTDCERVEHEGKGGVAEGVISSSARRMRNSEFFSKVERLNQQVRTVLSNDANKRRPGEGGRAVRSLYQAITEGSTKSQEVEGEEVAGKERTQAKTIHLDPYQLEAVDIACDLQGADFTPARQGGKIQQR
jgi:C-terminal peptidase prc